MKEAYLGCIKRLRKFRKSLTSDKDLKRGRLYFSWLKTKTEKIQNEQDNMYIYNNIAKYTLKNYKIDEYTYERLNDKLKHIIDNNYILKHHQYIFNNTNISFENTMSIAKRILFKRGNVVWVDFGFNIGTEFGGMHPAIILKNFESELLVVPISSKMPKEYKKIEQDLIDNKIKEDEAKERKEKATAIVQLDKIYKLATMIRWADITRIRKVSMLRLNYSGTIGKVDGIYMNKISEKIGKEF